MSEQKNDINSMTKSAKKDHIIEFLKRHKEYSDIIYSFKARPNSTFLFNPLDDELITEFFIDNAEEFILLLKAAVIQIVDSVAASKTIATQLRNNLKVKISEAREIKLQEWGPQQEGIPLATHCQVIGAMQEETYTKYAEVYCQGCGKREKDIKDLSHMPRCTNKECDYYRLLMINDPLKFKTGAIRTVMIQEPLEEVRHGIPRILPCILKDDDVFSTFIGQRKKLIGIFRSVPQMRKSTNRVSINAISVEDLEETEVMQPTPEQIQQFKKLVKQDNFQQIFLDSFSPELKYGGTELMKLCVVLAIMGGNKVGRIRDFIHCLLIGDPGTGKSKILEFVPEILQKAAIAVGGTMTGSGVTVTMDTLPNRQKMPRAGIVPTCTGGVACLDELNQLEEEDLGKILECMESGKIHYNKAGFDLTLVAETTILAGANPRGYVYDKSKTIVDNVHLPAPLISRFDFRINLLDDTSESEERTVLAHMDLIQEIGVDNYIKQNKLLTPKTLTLYFNYAKTLEPKMTPGATKLINDYHILMRSIDQPQGSFKIDKRFPESVKRVAIAYAKWYLSETVTEEIAMTVIEIFKKTQRTFGMNTESGVVQMNLQDAATTKRTAFVFAFREEQQDQEAIFIQEGPLLERMVRNNPKLFPNTDKAGDYFKQMDREGAMTYRGGRYKLD